MRVCPDTTPVTLMSDGVRYDREGLPRQPPEIYRVRQGCDRGLGRGEGRRGRKTEGERPRGPVYLWSVGSCCLSPGKGKRKEGKKEGGGKEKESIIVKFYCVKID